MAGFDDESAPPGAGGFLQRLFPPVPVVFKGEDGPITYHLVFRSYQYEKNPAQLLASSAAGMKAW